MPTATVQQIQKNYRITSIDLLRGLVMIIMALDHTREYFHWSAQVYAPLDFAHTSVAVFFTRWITHFCAPVFMFLTGTSAFLVGQRKPKKQLSFFLLTRGLWLMFLEVVVINFAWTFNFHFPFIMLGTLWALGVSMVALSVLIYLPLRAILVIGILIVVGHDLFDKFHVAGSGLKAFLWDELNDPADFKVYNREIITGYPVLSWIGISALGYCFGSFYKKSSDAVKRKKWLLILGSSAIIIFFIVRWLNVYGDPQPWSIQKNNAFTFLSFIRVTKYPPSLLYILITLGPALIFLAFSEKPLSRIGKIISTYGRVPMFYYLIHIYLLHLLAMLAAQLSGFGWRAMVLNGFPAVKGYGFSLAFVYLIWIGIVLFLYPFCRLYDKYKTSHKEIWWLSYL